MAIVGLTTVLLGTTLLLARWSFERGFLEYVNTVEQRRLDRAATSLAEFYETFGTWRLLTPQDYTRALGNPRAGVGRGNPEGPGRRLPPPGRAPPEGKRPPDRRGPPPDAIGPPGPDPAAPATALFDASGSHVIGPAEYASDADVITSPITVDGQTVGTLYTPLRRELTEPQEAEFAVSQRNASIVIAIIGFIVSIVLAMLLARLFLSPIQKLMTAVHRISDGDFETELAPAARDELGDLMHDVNRLVMVLRENQTSRQRWLADISHELRTPIAILVAELDALRDGVRPLELSQLESFSDEVSRIHRLIDDLHQLALSDMGGLRYEFAKLELAAFLDSRAEHFYRVSETQGHTLKLNIDTDNAWINADGERLSQLLDNLVMNAIS
ncbi:MAG: HAMP domain-containing protein, partial [Pseudomonadota bacterium]